MKTLFLFLLFPVILFSSRLEKGFDALKIYDYFKAKKMFQKSLKHHPAGASYGLSIIFYRSDNPFHNTDSAYKYILLAEKSFLSSSQKEKERLLKLAVSKPSVDGQKEKIIQQAFAQAKTENTLESFNWFIKNFSHAILQKDAVRQRNKVAFENTKKINTPQAYKDFISAYPDAEEIADAKWLYEFTLFNTLTKPNTIENYKTFINKFPKSPYRRQAEDSLFALSTHSETIDEYHLFIKNFPNNHNVKKAWEKIYTLATIDGTPSSYLAFLDNFSDFPDKQRVKKDIEISGKTFFPVQQDGKWGFIDSLGNILIPCSYEWADNFSEGAAIIIRNNKTGYINKAGAIIIQPFYDEANPFYNGIAVVKKDDKSGLINKLGKQILPYEYDDIGYDESIAKEKVIRTLKDGVSKFYDTNGKFLFEGKFEKAGDFSCRRGYIVKNNKYGFVNTKGEIIAPVEFDWVESFRSGIARVKQNDKFGLIDTSGKIILPCEYDRIDNFSEDLAIVVKEKKFGFADANGIIVIPIRFDYSPEISAADGFRNGLAKAEQNKKRGLIDKTGKFAVPCEYDDIRLFSEELCAVKKGKWGFIDKNKKQKINFQFDYAWDFHDGLARVKIKGKNGFVNRQGELTIAAVYDEATDFPEEVCPVKNKFSIVTSEGKKGAIDTSGKLIIPCEMNEIENAGSGILKMIKKNKMAYFNLSLQKQVWAENGF